jgi:hypothetical protein
MYLFRFINNSFLHRQLFCSFPVQSKNSNLPAVMLQLNRPANCRV